MKTTRSRLIEYMRVKKVATAAELAHILRITPADARHHLASLEDEGVVTVVDTHKQARGRPQQLYGLASELSRHNLDSLTNAVLSEWLDSMSEEGKDAALDKIAARFQDGYRKPEGNLTQRLTHAVWQLNHMHYQARWEAHMNAPRIILTHCPYALVVADHPEVCQMDVFLMGRLLGQPVTQLIRPALTVRGEVQCIFHLIIRQ